MGVEIIKELNPVLRGRLNYYYHARCEKRLKNLDSRLRHKLRCYRLKQCKRVISLQRFIENMGVKKWQSRVLALSGKGCWRKSSCPQAQQAMSLAWFEQQGLYNLTLNNRRLNNLWKPP